MVRVEACGVKCVMFGSQSTGDYYKAHFTGSLGHNSLVLTVPSTIADSAALHYSAIHFTALHCNIQYFTNCDHIYCSVHCSLNLQSSSSSNHIKITTRNVDSWGKPFREGNKPNYGHCPKGGLVQTLPKCQWALFLRSLILGVHSQGGRDPAKNVEALLKGSILEHLRLSESAETWELCFNQFGQCLYLSCFWSVMASLTLDSDCVDAFLYKCAAPVLAVGGHPVANMGPAKGLDMIPGVHTVHNNPQPAFSCSAPHYTEV